MSHFGGLDFGIVADGDLVDGPALAEALGRARRAAEGPILDLSNAAHQRGASTISLPQPPDDTP